MLRYFTSRELSEKFGINLARWKRWSRAFLPPDPLGGQQSGYARQFSIDQAFRVYLGGVLLSRLKFSVSEAEQILGDLDNWLEAAGIYLNGEPDPDLIEQQLDVIRPCLIIIGPDTQSNPGRSDFAYCLHGKSRATPAQPVPADSPWQCYQSFSIDGLPFVHDHPSWNHLHVLNINNILNEFIHALGLDSRLYPQPLVLTS
jgi:hypothetical protein